MAENASVIKLWLYRKQYLRESVNREFQETHTYCEIESTLIGCKVEPDRWAHKLEKWIWFFDVVQAKIITDAVPLGCPMLDKVYYSFLKNRIISAVKCHKTNGNHFWGGKKTNRLHVNG